MNFFERMRFVFSNQRKLSEARVVSSIMKIGQAQSTPANYENIAKLGYQKNVVVFRAVHMIAKASSGICWNLYNKKSNGDLSEPLSEHPLVALMKKPNPLSTQTSFMEAVVAYYCLTGNAYIEKNRGVLKGGPALELWPVRPDKMKIIPNKEGYPAAFIYKDAGQERRWEVNPVTMQSDIIHWKTFSPLNDWYGMSPLEAAMLSLDQNNAGQLWNLSMLRNGAQPSGVLQMKVTDSNPRGELTNEQYKRVKTELEESYQGARNAGRPMLIEGGLEWKQTSLGPKDMDYINNKETTAEDLCLVFGVPGELMGFGEKTFNNYQEARLAFYEETVLPIMDGVRDVLNNSVAPDFGDNLFLDYDRDDIEALQYRRQQKFVSLGTVNFLDQNEKRDICGYEPKEGLDDVFVVGSQVLTSEDMALGSAGAQPPTNPNDPNNPDDPNNPNNPQDPNADPNADPNKKPKPKVPPKKPDPNAEDDNAGKGWKSFNRLNRVEKVGTWRAQNQKRARLEKQFKRDIKADFHDLAKELAQAAKTKGDAQMKELAIVHRLNDFMPNIKRTIGKNIRFVLNDFGDQILGEGKAFSPVGEKKSRRKFDHFVDEYIQKRTAEAISHIEGTTVKQVRRVVKEWVQETIDSGDTLPELSDMIQAEFEGLSEGRANTIARTEVSMASNNASIEAVRSLQIVGMTKEWVSANDDRVRDGGKGGHDADHTSGDWQEPIPIEEQFNVPPGDVMDHPGDDGAPAGQVCNCRCVLVYKTTAATSGGDEE